MQALVFDRLIKDDYITGDKHGPYEASVVKAERVRMALVSFWTLTLIRALVCIHLAVLLAPKKCDCCHFTAKKKVV